MNLGTKMGLVRDEGQPIELTWRFHINFASSLKEVKHDNDEIMQIDSQRIWPNVIW